MMKTDSPEEEQKQLGTNLVLSATSASQLPLGISTAVRTGEVNIATGNIYIAIQPRSKTQVLCPFVC